VLFGVPVADVQKTTIRTFMVKGVEENKGLHPHIRWAKIPDFFHVYRGILPMNLSIVRVNRTKVRKVS
jgi:hypothetical protein